METQPEKRGIFDNPKNITALLYALYIMCVLLFCADLIIHKHAYFPFEKAIGFYGIYGFISYVGLVMLAKHVIRPILMRKENYYD